MDWNPPTLWWLATGALVAAELATGTFYLLMVALGCAAGALAAHAGLSGTTQVITAALLGLVATAAWHLHRARQPGALPAHTNRDVNLDIGSPVRVNQWQADGSARVHYRGSTWSVRFAGSGTPRPGEHVIVAVQGSELRVTPVET
ncbi:MAG TPA: NfeD family protein [Rubrivivax sp.]|nr:NfeD family protein [Rubrivivax sp.]